MFDPNSLFQQALRQPNPVDSVMAMLDLAEKAQQFYDPSISHKIFTDILPYIVSKMYEMPANLRDAPSRRLVLVGGLIGYTHEDIGRAAKQFKTFKPATQTPIPSPQNPTSPRDSHHHQPGDMTVTSPTPTKSVRTSTSWNASTTAMTHSGDNSALARHQNSSSEQKTPTLELGEAIAQVYTDYGHPNVRYLPEELGENSRFHLLVFAWQSGDNTKKIKDRRSELSLVGLNPDDIRIVITEGVHTHGKFEGRFEVQIPKEDWTPCLLLVWLYERCGGPNLRDRMQMIEWLVRNIPKAKPSDPFVTTFGLDLRNEAIQLTQRKGVFSVGSPDSGKSVNYRSRTTEALLTHTPETLEIYAIDLKRVTFEPFRDLVHLIDDPNLIPSFLEALRKEAQDRNNEFAKVGVTDILQYNTKFPHKPMPILWVIVDEIYKVRQEVSDPDLLKRIEELTGFTRSVGIYWDIATQYPSRDYAVTPATRNNLSEKILFSCDDNAADLVLKVSNAEDLASSLLSAGDALVRTHHRKKRTTRAQSFFIPDDPDQDHLLEVLHTLKISRPPLKPSKLLQGLMTNPSLTPSEVENGSGNAWSAPSSTEALIQTQRERAKWLLIQQVEAHRQSNPDVPSLRRLYTAVYGDLGNWLTQDQKEHYQSCPVETLQDLLRTPQLEKDDPRNRAFAGANEETSKRYIETLRRKFSELSAA